MDLHDLEYAQRKINENQYKWRWWKKIKFLIYGYLRMSNQIELIETDISKLIMDYYPQKQLKQ